MDSIVRVIKPRKSKQTLIVKRESLLEPIERRRFREIILKRPNPLAPLGLYVNKSPNGKISYSVLCF